MMARGLWAPLISAAPMRGLQPVSTSAQMSSSPWLLSQSKGTVGADEGLLPLLPVCCRQGLLACEAPKVWRRVTLPLGCNGGVPCRLSAWACGCQTGSGTQATHRMWCERQQRYGVFAAAGCSQGSSQRRRADDSPGNSAM